MGEFRFKRFSVINERSAMKVNTDGVLLGALMTICPADRRLLDVGTGTGTVALMAAQRLSDLLAGMADKEGHAANGHDSPVLINAIDIDEPSAAEAAENFARSPWKDMLSAENVSLESFTEGMGTDGPGHAGNEDKWHGCFDLIFSNPPYFESELKAPDMRRREARHAVSLSYREILEFSSRWLSPGGRCSMILPSEIETDVCRYGRMCGLFPFRIVRIRTVPVKLPRRIVAEFSRERCGNIAEELLTIQEEGRYTDRYTDLTSPFYLQV